MIRGLSTLCTWKFENLEELIGLAQQNGFGAVDATGEELRAMVGRMGIAQANRFLKEKEVVISSFPIKFSWSASENEFRDGLPELIRDAETFSQFGSPICQTFIMPSTDEKIFPWTVTATRRIKLCARILNEYGIRLALEPVGPRHMREKYKNPFIWNIKDTMRWISLMDEPNVGILLDSIHWYTGGDTVGDILALHPEEILLVHINDARDVPVAEVYDNDRLYPGEGVIDLKSFTGALKKIGYNGVATLEVITPVPQTEAIEKLVKKSGMAFERLGI